LAARKLVLRKIEGFIKGVFARFRSPQPPVVIRRRKSGGWEAESFLISWRGLQIPTRPKQSLSPSGRLHTTWGSSLAAFACLRSKPAFPFRGITCIKYSSTILSFFQKARKDRNTKRHFAFGEKTFALRVRVALMNIYPHPL